MHSPGSTLTAEPSGSALQREDSAGRSRIKGIDVARGIAMAAMTITHFVAWREGDGLPHEAAELFRGRAMPLFMLLGGVGVTLMTRRSTVATRALLIRSAMLMALGLFLQAQVDRLAIVLQSYAVLFVLAIGLHRLPSRVLAALVPIIVAVGAVTYQTVGAPRELTRFDIAFSWEGLQSLFIDGFYPVFPIGAFFVFGMWLARLDLRDPRVVSWLSAAGAMVGLGAWAMSRWIVESRGLQPTIDAVTGDGAFHWERLLDVEGHSAMPAWVLSALGSSTAVLGLCLLAAPAVGRALTPLRAVGAMSLSYYVFQAWATNVVPPTAETGVLHEWALTALVFGIFVVFALVWKLRFNHGPLEWLFRLSSWRRRPPPPAPIPR